MPLRSIVYTSFVVPGTPQERVAEIARDAARFNVYAGVTGLLLFDGMTFLQYLEGPDDGMHVVYARIMQSKNHVSLVELGRAEPPHRLFSQWSMQFAVTRHDLDGLAHRGDWRQLALRPQADRDIWLGTERMEAIALHDVV